MPDGVSSHGPSIDGGQNLVTISIKCATLKDSAPPKNSPVSRNYVSREGAVLSLFTVDYVRYSKMKLRCYTIIMC